MQGIRLGQARAQIEQILGKPLYDGPEKGDQPWVLYRDPTNRKEEICVWYHSGAVVRVVGRQLEIDGVLALNTRTPDSEVEARLGLASFRGEYSKALRREKIRASTPVFAPLRATTP